MSELVSIDKLKMHPRNYRRGDVDAIKRSLKAYGQIHSVTVSSRTKHVLDGNHTVKAAKALGWKDVAVNWIDVDEQTEMKILVAANGVHAQGSYNEDVLLSMLRDIAPEDLPPTGYDEFFIYDLIKNSEPLDLDSEEKDDDEVEETTVKITVGTYYTMVTKEIFEPWSRNMKERYGKKALHEIKDRLGFTLEAEKAPAVRTPADTPITERKTVPIDSVHLAPSNPREGDVGAIIESFRALGIFKPITVNERTNTIVAGNHRWMAAKALGYTEIDVEYIDVDQSKEKLIVLADNRIADLGENDSLALANLLKEIDDTSGLGYSLSTMSEESPAQRSQYKLNIGNVWKCKLDTQSFQRWKDDFLKFEQNPELFILDRLGLIH